MLKLNLGAGGLLKPESDGWVNIDRLPLLGINKVANVRKLDYPDGSVDEINAQDILEHFHWEETGDVLREWRRVMKKGAHIYIQVPDLERLCQRYCGTGLPELDAEQLSTHLYAWKRDMHKAGFDKKFLVRLLAEVGFEPVSDDWPHSDGGMNLLCLAKAV
jgi:predicted SAM-dependent methyltransferase